jgi:hypothetical protein
VGMLIVPEWVAKLQTRRDEGEQLCTIFGGSEWLGYDKNPTQRYSQVSMK